MVRWFALFAVVAIVGVSSLTLLTCHFDLLQLLIYLIEL